MRQYGIYQCYVSMSFFMSQYTNIHYHHQCTDWQTNWPVVGLWSVGRYSLGFLLVRKLENFFTSSTSSTGISSEEGAAGSASSPACPPTPRVLQLLCSWRSFLLIVQFTSVSDTAPMVFSKSCSWVERSESTSGGGSGSNSGNEYWRTVNIQRDGTKTWWS